MIVSSASRRASTKLCRVLLDHGPRRIAERRVSLELRIISLARASARFDPISLARASARFDPAVEVRAFYADRPIVCSLAGNQRRRASQVPQRASRARVLGVRP